MSIPASVTLPPGVAPVSVGTRRTRLAALHAGPSRQPDVLLVPGFSGSKEDFLPLLPLLADRGWSVWAIDQHGQFESHGPDEDSSYSLSGWAADVVDLTAQTAGVHVVGHSFGGLVCREAALADPTAMRSLTLLDSGPGALPERHHDRLALLTAAIPEFSLEAIWQIKEQLDAADGVPRPPAEIAEFLHRRWVTGSPGALMAMARTLVTCPDRVAELHDVVLAGLACLVAYGADDDTSWTRAEMADMATRLGGEAVVVPDAAHSPAVENPRFTADMFDAFFRAAASSGGGREKISGIGV